MIAVDNIMRQRFGTSLKSAKLFGLVVFAVVLWGSAGVSPASSQTGCNASNPYRSLTAALNEPNKAGVCKILHDGDTKGQFNQINLFPNLTELRIQGDDTIEAVPRQIGELKKLQIFELSGLKIKTLPDTFSAMGSESATGFIDISISFTSLTTLPDNFGAFQKPVKLKIRGKEWGFSGSGGLEKLPESFGQLRIKETLDLRYNKLTELPASFGKLTAFSKTEEHLLWQILLSHNHLQRLPTFEARASGQGFIRKIDLSYNDLRSIRGEFEPIKLKRGRSNEEDTGLSELSLDYNPLVRSQVPGLVQRMHPTKVSAIKLGCVRTRDCLISGQHCNDEACEYQNTALGDWCGLSGDLPCTQGLKCVKKETCRVPVVSSGACTDSEECEQELECQQQKCAVGRKGVGGACQKTDDCRSGLTCGETSTCEKTVIPLGGSCAADETDTSKCEGTSTCKNNTCRLLLSKGAECVPAEISLNKQECAAGSQCLANAQGQSACRIPKGGPCSAADALYCALNTTCEPQGAGKTCKQTSNIGESCLPAKEFHCAAGLTCNQTTARCQKTIIAKGAPCTISSISAGTQECAAGSQCLSNAQGQTKCLIPKGGSCTAADANNCEGTSQCTNNKCSQLIAQGQRCVLNNIRTGSERCAPGTACAAASQGVTRCRKILQSGERCTALETDTEMCAIGLQYRTACEGSGQIKRCVFFQDVPAGLCIANIIECRGPDLSCIRPVGSGTGIEGKCKTIRSKGSVCTETETNSEKCVGTSQCLSGKCRDVITKGTSCTATETDTTKCEGTSTCFANPPTDPKKCRDSIAAGSPCTATSTATTACTPGTQCTSGKCKTILVKGSACTATETDTAKCEGTSQCLGGKCKAVIAKGTACTATETDTAKCEGASQCVDEKCRDLIAQGDSCKTMNPDTQACEPPTTCEAEGNGKTKTCKKTVGLNDICSPSKDFRCSAGLTCDASTNKCAKTVVIIQKGRACTQTMVETDTTITQCEGDSVCNNGKCKDEVKTAGVSCTDESKTFCTPDKFECKPEGNGKTCKAKVTKAGDSCAPAAEKFCDPTLTCLGGTCKREISTVGGECTDSNTTYCNAQLKCLTEGEKKTCKREQNRGGSCTPSASYICKERETANGGRLQCLREKCIEIVERGKQLTIAREQQCEGELALVGGYCKEGKRPGGKCTPANEFYCLSGQCKEGFCKEPRDIGDSCGDSSKEFCKEGVGLLCEAEGVSKVCKQLQQDGESCEPLSRFVCKIGSGCTADKYCKKLLDAGDPLTDSSKQQCKPELDLVAGRCKQKKQQGQICTDGNKTYCATGVECRNASGKVDKYCVAKIALGEQCTGEVTKEYCEGNSQCRGGYCKTLGYEGNSCVPPNTVQCDISLTCAAKGPGKDKCNVVRARGQSCGYRNTVICDPDVAGLECHDKNSLGTGVCKVEFTLDQSGCNAQNSKCVPLGLVCSGNVCRKRLIDLGGDCSNTETTQCRGVLQCQNGTCEKKLVGQGEECTNEAEVACREPDEYTCTLQSDKRKYCAQVMPEGGACIDPKKFVCQSGLDCVSGQCAKHVAGAGESCENLDTTVCQLNLKCTTTDKKCKQELTLGQSNCTDTNKTYCAPTGLVCTGGKCAKKVVEDGQSCASKDTVECKSGSRCTGNNTCKKVIGVGGSCQDTAKTECDLTKDLSCKSNICTQTVPLGGDCQGAGKACAGLAVCSNNRCEKRQVDPGGACDNNETSVCKGGVGVEGQCIGSRCVHIVPVGYACNPNDATRRCKGVLECRNFQCVKATRQAGQSCEPADETRCDSGLSCSVDDKLCKRGLDADGDCSKPEETFCKPGLSCGETSKKCEKKIIARGQLCIATQTPTEKCIVGTTCEPEGNGKTCKATVNLGGTCAPRPEFACSQGVCSTTGICEKKSVELGGMCDPTGATTVCTPEGLVCDSVSKKCAKQVIGAGGSCKDTETTECQAGLRCDTREDQPEAERFLCKAVMTEARANCANRKELMCDPNRNLTCDANVCKITIKTLGGRCDPVDRNVCTVGECRPLGTAVPKYCKEIIAVGGFCVATISATKDCAGTSQCLADSTGEKRCRNTVAAGTPCENLDPNTQACASPGKCLADGAGVKKCRSEIAQGVTCKTMNPDTQQCIVGTECKAEGTDKTCKATVGLAVACTPTNNFECTAGLRCDTGATNKCVKTVVTIAKGGDCEQTSSETDTTITKCEGISVCREGKCREEVKVAGGVCTDANKTFCTPGTFECLSVPGSASVKKCTTILAEGGNCGVANTACGLALQCSENRCVCKPYTNVNDAIARPADVCALTLTNNATAGAVLKDVSRMTNLQELHAGKTGLPALPTGLAAASKLRVLKAYENTVAALPADITKIGAAATGPMELNLAFNDLSELPASIGELKKPIKYLYLKGNKLRALPESFADLTITDRLDLSEQKDGDRKTLTRLPDNFWELKLGTASSPAELDLHGNALTTLPEFHSNTYISTLDLSDNAIKVVPGALGALGTRVKTIKLNGNPLKRGEADKLKTALLGKGVTVDYVAPARSPVGGACEVPEDCTPDGLRCDENVCVKQEIAKGLECTATETATAKCQGNSECKADAAGVKRCRVVIAKAGDCVDTITETTICTAGTTCFTGKCKQSLLPGAACTATETNAEKCVSATNKPIACESESSSATGKSCKETLGAGGVCTDAKKTDCGTNLECVEHAAAEKRCKKRITVSLGDSCDPSEIQVSSCPANSECVAYGSGKTCQKTVGRGVACVPQSAYRCSGSDQCSTTTEKCEAPPEIVCKPAFSSITAAFAEPNRKTVCELDLANTGITGLSLARIHEFVNLKKLDTRLNNLKTLPNEFGQLAKLANLDLSNSGLTALPANFGSIGSAVEPAQLIRLNVGNESSNTPNRLTELPQSFGELRPLEFLNISNNAVLARLPESFGDLTIRGTLDLRGNALSALPASFGNLKLGRRGNSSYLYLDNNRLTGLPRFGASMHVISLSLANNKLKVIPSWFLEHPDSLGSLGRLDLSGNPLQPADVEAFRKKVKELLPASQLGDCSRWPDSCNISFTPAESAVLGEPCANPKPKCLGGTTCDAKTKTCVAPPLPLAKVGELCGGSKPQCVSGYDCARVKGTNNPAVCVSKERFRDYLLCDVEPPSKAKTWCPKGSTPHNEYFRDIKKTYCLCGKGREFKNFIVVVAETSAASAAPAAAVAAPKATVVQKQVSCDAKVFTELDEVQSLVDRGEAGRVCKLRLAKQGLVSVPAIVGMLTELRELYLNENQLTRLDVDTAELKKLERLALYSNAMQTLPEGIGNLKNLAVIYLNNNQLKTVPSSIKDLTALTDFRAPGNLFSEQEKERIRSLLPKGINIEL